MRHPPSEIDSGQSNSVRMVVDMLRGYRSGMVLLIVLSITTALLDSFSITIFVPLLGSFQHVTEYDRFPLILQQLAQLFAVFPFERQILYLVSLMVFVLLAKNVFMGVTVHVGYRLTTHMISDLRSRIMAMLLAVDIAYFSGAKTGELLDNIMSSTHRIELVVKSFSEFLVNTILLLFLLLLMFLLSWKLSVVTLCCSVFIMLGFSWYTGKIKELSNKLIGHRLALANMIAETISGISVIKLFAKESVQSNKLNRCIQTLGTYHLWSQTGSSLISNLSEMSGTLVVGILIIFTLQIGELTSGSAVTRLLAFIYILIRLLPVIKELNRTRVVIVSNWPYLDQVSKLLSRRDKPFMTDGTLPFGGLREGIRFAGVSFRYEGTDDFVLKDFDTFIPKNTTVAIIGESGAGKSTIAHLLMRLHDPQTGEILLDGIPLPKFSLSSYRQQIGIVSQEVFIFDDTVLNNIAFGALDDPPETAIIDAARQAGAHDFIQGLPDGYNTRLGERGVRLSGGQRQRLSIARAILKNPSILILDEATSSLDFQTETFIHRALMQLRQNRTIIMITHRLSTVEGADMVVSLGHDARTETKEQRSRGSASLL